MKFRVEDIENGTINRGNGVYIIRNHVFECGHPGDCSEFAKMFPVVVEEPEEPAGQPGDEATGEEEQVAEEGDSEVPGGPEAAESEQPKARPQPKRSLKAQLRSMNSHGAY